LPESSLLENPPTDPGPSPGSRPIVVAVLGSAAALAAIAGLATRDLRTALVVALFVTLTGAGVVALTSWTGRAGRARESALLSRVTALEAEARDRAVRSEAFVRAMNDIAYRHLIATHEIRWTGAIEGLFDTLPEPHRGHLDGWRTLLHPEDVTVAEATLADLHASDDTRIDSEYRLRTVDGTYRWFHDRGVVRRAADGTAVEIEGLLRDVTNSVRLRNALAEEQARMQATFDQTALGVAEGTIGGRLTRVNPRYCEILGRSETEILSRRFGDYTHPDDRDSEQTHLQILQRGGPVSYSREKRYVRPDGRVVWVTITVSLVRPLAGREPFFSAILEDITARREAEREAAESRTRLARYAETLTLAIEAERTRIAQEIHDALGQALTSLKMDIAWVRRRLSRDVDPVIGAPITDRLEGMATFIDETIVVARRLASELRPAILDSLGLAPALRAHALDFSRRTEVVFDCDVEELPLPRTTATALYRIALEACTNVARHARATHTWLSLRAEGDEAVLEIRDDGVGFDPHGLAGAGMGLVGITERAMLAGGQARIEAAPGSGTSIRVRVPMAASPSSSEVLEAP
jgi:PAS domain S-box-containing protein